MRPFVVMFTVVATLAGVNPVFAQFDEMAQKLRILHADIAAANARIEADKRRKPVVPRTRPPAAKVLPPVPAMKSGGWRILPVVESSTCHMKATFDGGTSLVVELDPSDEGYNLYLSNARWTSLENSKEYDLTYVFPGIYYQDTETLAINEGKTEPTLHSAFDADFGTNFAGSSYVVIKRGDKAVEKLSLNGSSKALLEMVVCARAEYRKAKIDPFAN